VFRCLGLEPGANGRKYQQPFTNSNGAKTANVIGVLRGTDPTVGGDIIVVAAHHDHFGTLGDEGLRLGANDNASGVAGLLATAITLEHAGPLKRTVAFIAFGAEETLEEPPWDEGSDFFVKHAPRGLPVDRVVHVTTMDMIGTYSDEDNVDAMGTAKGTPGRAVLEGLIDELGLSVTLDAGAEDGDSDFDPFCRRGVPYVGFFTEDSECYHEACDTADHLDYEHMATIVTMATRLTTGLANSAVDLARAKREVRDPCRFH
jgi:Zn-dependent M28 family amino/carboxypeptidase